MTILDTRRFLRGKIREVNPDIEQRSGSTVGTMLVKPLSVMINPFEEEVNFIKTQLSLADVSSLSSDNVDQLVENLFLKRKIGSVASGVVRAYFSSPQDAAFPLGTGFVDVSGQLFFASEKTVMSQAEMSLNVDGSLYYMDINVVASSDGSSYNIAANQIVSLQETIVGVVRVTNLNPFTSGKATETDDEFVERAQQAITVRNLINRRSVNTVLLDEFNFIKSIQPIGFGDPEMIRDIIEVQTSQGPKDIHIAGHADLYIEPETMEESSTQIQDVDMVGNLFISTNQDRGLITQSSKPGLHIDIAPGFFDSWELKGRQAVKLDPSSIYYIYVDAFGELQIDNIISSFPGNSYPLGIVQTATQYISSITDSRDHVIEFNRPIVEVTSVVELDPTTLEETDRALSNGRNISHYSETDTDGSVTYNDSVVNANDEVFTSYIIGGKINISHFSSTGDLISTFTGLDSSLATSRNPNLMIDSLGRLHVVFENNFSSTYDIYHARLSQDWTIEIAASSLGVTTGSSGSSATIDESNNLHISYVDGNDVKSAKIDPDGLSLIAAITSSTSSNAKQSTSITVSGNLVTSSETGESDGTTSFKDLTNNFPVSVYPGQTLVLTGGSLDYSAYLDGTQSEPAPFSAEITSSISSATLDTSIASGYNSFDVLVDGVLVSVAAFTDSPVTPIATVIGEINTASLATALASSVASNSGSDEIVITSPTTGVSSTISVVSDNAGIGFLSTDSDQGGTGFDTSVANGTNTISFLVDGTEIDVTFTDTKGNPIATVISEINAESNLTALASDVAFDAGGYIRFLSPTTGLSSSVDVTSGNQSLGFSDGTREEGGSELGRRIGISAVVDPTEITLSEIIRTVSVTGDINYRIESVETTTCWTEDGNVHFAKMDDTGSIFVADKDTTKEYVVSSTLAVPLSDALYTGPNAGEITLNDTTATFVTDGVRSGNTVRIISSTPSLATSDFVVSRVVSETILVLSGALSSSPANSVTYEIFLTNTYSKVSSGSNTDNEVQIYFTTNSKSIGRIEIDRLGTVLSDNRRLITRPYNISSLSSHADASDYSHVAWTESVQSYAKPYFCKISELGYVTLEPTLASDSRSVSRNISIIVNSEYQPVITWNNVDYSNDPESPDTTLSVCIWSAQDYYVKVNSPATNMSIKEDRSIVFTKEFLYQPVVVKYNTSQHINTVEDYVQSPENQIIDSNYLVKHFLMAKVYANISYSGSVSDPAQVVMDFINSVTSERLESSDIADALYTAGATQVALPFDMIVRYTDIDGTYIEDSNQDVITIPRIARYFADSNSVSVTSLG